MALLVVALLYAWIIHYAHVNYLNPEWEYQGFTYRALSFLEVALMVTFVAIGALTMPVVLRRASSIVVLLLFLVVYVPATVITLGLDVDRVVRYGPSLAMLCLGFVLISLVARLRLGEPRRWSGVPSEVFLRVFFLVWCFCGMILIATQGSIMSFAIEDEVYEQRAIGAATNLFIGYVQTYFSNVLSPALIALGLLKSRAVWVATGTTGCLLMYMIGAQRTVLLLPVVIIGMFVLLRSRRKIFQTSAFCIALIGIAVYLCVWSYVDDNEDLAKSALTYLLVQRTIGVPGLVFSQYFDLFSANGFTWWSHVKGLDLLIGAPRWLASDPSWPNLGVIVAERVYGSAGGNANASLFAGDGVAAAGAFGVFVISMVCALWLYLLDRAARGWDRQFAILVILPVALSLTNGHLFTTLLSFGGLFWLLTFHFYKPPPPGHPQRLPYLNSSLRRAV